MPLCPPCLIDSPFIWLKRLSSLMLFSCKLSMGCGRNSVVIRLNHYPVQLRKLLQAAGAANREKQKKLSKYKINEMAIISCDIFRATF